MTAADRTRSARKRRGAPRWSAIRYQIPAFDHEAVRVEGVRPRFGGAAVAVAQPHPAVREDGRVERVQIDGRTRCLHPARGVHQDPAAGQLGSGPVGFGQRGHHLAQRGAQRLVEAERAVGALGGQDEQRAGLVRRQSGDIRTEARQQGDPAVPAALGVDGDTGGGKGLDVAVDGAHGHLQALGELGGGHETAGLEQQEDREQPVGFHVASVSGKHDGRCQVIPEQCGWPASSELAGLRSSRRWMT